MKEGRDDFVDLMEEAIEGFNITAGMGRFLVDVIPPCKSLLFRYPHRLADY